MYKPTKTFLALLVLFSVGLKLLPYLLNIWSLKGYPWGLTLTFAVGIFGVAMFRDRKLAFGLPLLIWLLSDIGVGLVSITQFGTEGWYRWAFYPGQVFNYLSLVIVAACGLLVRRWQNWGTILAASVIGPTLFFLITNPAAWYFDTTMTYSRDWAGVMTSYAAGLPYYKAYLASTVAFCGLLFSPLGVQQLKRDDELSIAKTVPATK